MSLTALDPKTALVVIDLQKGIAHLQTTPAVADVVKQVARLAQAFRERNLPVVLVNVTGAAPGRTDAPAPAISTFPPDWSEVVPELKQHPDDRLITKQRWGAFIGTFLDEELRRMSVTQIVLVGVATSIGVESTARSAYDYGYNVTLVTDAMTDRNPEAHLHSIEKIFPRLGETTTTDMLLHLLHSS